MPDKHLYMVHCGFYDRFTAGGIFEQHVNFFVVAEDVADAKARARLIPEFKAKKMHVDGLQRIEVVDGYRIGLKEDPLLAGLTQVTSINGWQRSTASRLPS